MAITASLVKELRERTGSGMMECKKALVETDGDIEAAIDVAAPGARLGMVLIETPANPTLDLFDLDMFVAIAARRSRGSSSRLVKRSPSRSASLGSHNSVISPELIASRDARSCSIPGSSGVAAERASKTLPCCRTAPWRRSAGARSSWPPTSPRT